MWSEILAGLGVLILLQINILLTLFILKQKMDIKERKEILRPSFNEIESLSDVYSLEDN